VAAARGIGQEFAHQGRQFAQADCGPSGIVGGVLRPVGKQHPRQRFGHVFDVNDAAHGVGVRKADRLAAGWLAHAVHMIDRAKLLVGTGHIGRTDAGDRDAVCASVIVGLPFVDDLVDGVLRLAASFVGLIDEALAKSGLLATDGDRAGEHRMLNAAPARRLEAVIHSLDIELESIVGSEFANEVGKVD